MHSNSVLFLSYFSTMYREIFRYISFQDILPYVEVIPGHFTLRGSYKYVFSRTFVLLTEKGLSHVVLQSKK